VGREFNDSLINSDDAWHRDAHGNDATLIIQLSQRRLNHLRDDGNHLVDGGYPSRFVSHAAYDLAAEADEADGNGINVWIDAHRDDAIIRLDHRTRPTHDSGFTWFRFSNEIEVHHLPHQSGDR
jgi:hypothetical protein